MLEDLHSKTVNKHSGHKERIVEGRWCHQSQDTIELGQVADCKASAHGTKAGDHEGPRCSALKEGDLLCPEQVDNEGLGHQTLKEPNCSECSGGSVGSIVCLEEVPGYM